MRLMLFGSGAFGLPTFEAMHAEHEVVAVVSQPDKPAGRKRVLTPTPVAQWALKQGLPVLRSDDVNTPQFIDQVKGCRPDASVVIAFGQKLCPALIGAMGSLAVNLHSSLLPRYRGAAPINWAMIHGDTQTGVSVIALAQTMDAGEIYAAQTLTIDPNEIAGELHDRLSALGPDAVGRVLADLAGGTLKAIAQDPSQATRAPKFKKADGTADFNNPATLVRARIHGLTPWPGCKVNWRCQASGQSMPLTIKRVEQRVEHGVEQRPDDLLAASGTQASPGTVLDDYCVACAQGSVRLIEVQVAGKQAMKIEDFARGHGLAAGDVLSAIV